MQHALLYACDIGGLVRLPDRVRVGLLPTKHRHALVIGSAGRAALAMTTRLIMTKRRGYKIFDGMTTRIKKHKVRIGS